VTGVAGLEFVRPKDGRAVGDREKEETVRFMRDKVICIKSKTSLIVVAAQVVIDDAIAKLVFGSFMPPLKC
jgi:hypothetical protein